MGKVFNPCYKCEQRIAGCHTTCEKYKKFNIENKAYKNSVYEARTKDGNVYIKAKSRVNKNRMREV